MASDELLDHPLISERYFFPRPSRVADPWIVQTEHGRLEGYRSAPHGGAALLHFHGNGEVVADWAGDFCAGLNAQGLDVFLGEYRGYGGSDGRPALAGMLDDALVTADATGVPAERLVLYGRSVGSLYALHVAAHRPVAGLVLESGIADVRQRLTLRVRAHELGVDSGRLWDAIEQTFDHRAKLERTRCPVLVMHALGDHLVDPDHARTLARWAGDRAELVLFRHGDHNTIHAYNGEEIRNRLVDFVGMAAAANAG